MHYELLTQSIHLPNYWIHPYNQRTRVLWMRGLWTTCYGQIFGRQRLKLRYVGHSYRNANGRSIENSLWTAPSRDKNKIDTVLHGLTFVHDYEFDLVDITEQCACHVVVTKHMLRQSTSRLLRCCSRAKASPRTSLP